MEYKSDHARIVELEERVAYLELKTIRGIDDRAFAESFEVEPSDNIDAFNLDTTTDIAGITDTGC